MQRESFLFIRPKSIWFVYYKKTNGILSFVWLLLIGLIDFGDSDVGGGKQSFLLMMLQPCINAVVSNFA